MLGDHLQDFTIDVPQLLEMIARLPEESQNIMLEMMQGYLQMAHAGFIPRDIYSDFVPKYSWPYLRDELSKIDSTKPYPYTS
jgi:hypothetical protein